MALLGRIIHRRHAATASGQKQPQAQGYATSPSPSSSTPSPEDTLSPRPSRLRNKPWSFTPDYTFQSRHHVSLLARFQVTISELAEEGKFINCLHACKEMKDNGVAPDLLIYNDLLKAAARDGLHRQADAIMDDMIAVGIRPDRQSYHHLIYVRAMTLSKCKSRLLNTNRQNAP
jgi:pentatricopeptide repeat protein